MVPRVVVWSGMEREILLSRLGVRQEEILGYEGKGAAVDDFRHWVNTALGILGSRPSLKLVVWEADSLSWECQAVLLKPLEELAESLSIYLIVINENNLTPTIISRCMVVYHTDKVGSNDYWPTLLECWKQGPASCLELADQLDLDAATKMINEAVYKLSSNLATGVNEKRLLVLNEVITCAEDLKQKNINLKLALGDFLLRTWGLIKT